MSVREKKLNKRERYKAQQSPYEYYPNIETLDFSSISEGDGFYLQDFGIFNTPLEEEAFTLRLRITAGRIRISHLRALADIAEKERLDIILTARAGMQLHGLTSDNVLRIFKQVNALGISTWQTFGDNIRNIVTDVYDGRGPYSKIETYPLIMQMEEYFLKTPRLIGLLPRRISTGISGTSANVSPFFANDLYFALASRDETLGFNVYMGGKNTEIARNADIFLPPEEVVAFFIAFIEAFHRHGSRFARARTRLFYLLEDIGLETFKEHIAAEYRKPWQSAGDLIQENGRFSQYERLNDGLYGFCYETNFGRIRSEELHRIADYAQAHGAEVRLGTDQNIYLLGVPKDSSPFENLTESQSVLACAGSHYCPYSFWNIKDDAPLLPLSALKKHRIQVGISGCAKGCGRHQHADIGLIGLRTNNFGDADKAARIYLGAEHTNGISLGRELFSMVPYAHIASVIELIIDEYEQSGVETFESFSADVVNAYSIEFLSLWFLAKLDTGRQERLPRLKRPKPLLEEISFAREKEILEEYFADESFLVLIEDDFLDAIRQMSKKLWNSGKTHMDIAPQIKKLLVSKKYWETPHP